MRTQATAVAAAPPILPEAAEPPAVDDSAGTYLPASLISEDCDFAGSKAPGLLFWVGVPVWKVVTLGFLVLSSLLGRGTRRFDR